ncbi:MAG: ATP-dependent helicase [Planctomycetes bacterium]|nr:ATP-dependent helicase [Planctomycetota bacterium]
MAEPPLRLSPEQKKVVDHRGGPLQVIACAGSGKTESLSRRVAALITEGTDPSSIVAFTFTERAASELKARIVRRVAESLGEQFLDRLGPMFVGTIHGYCFRLLQDHVPRFGNYDVLDEHRHAGLLSREYKRLGLSALGPRHWSPIREFTHNVDVIGNELIDTAALAGTPLGVCYAAYRSMLDRYHFITFGQIISHAVDALEDPSVFAHVHAPLRHLLVDEYQDVNPAQERLIELLARDPVELCVVGDDDQAIYQWRGSDLRNILEFANRRAGTTTVNLATNRRSRPGIVAKANSFAATIPHRLAKSMQHAREEAPHEIVPWSSATEEEETTTIAATIARLHSAGHRYADIAVLYRSVRTSAPPLIEALRERRIPFQCGGRTGLFLQSEIALFGETFAWLVDGDWKDERYGKPRKADLGQLVAGYQAAFGDVQFTVGIERYLEDWKRFTLRGNRTVSLVGDFYRLLAALGVDSVDSDTAEGAARLGSYARFAHVLGDFEAVTRRGRFVETDSGRAFKGGRDRGKHYLRGLANYLVHYARDAYEEFEGEEVASLDAVSILTVHQAKGLEWSIVFIPALVVGRFPARAAGRTQDWLLPQEVFPAHKRVRYEGGDSEERRLFYVALTRARDLVYLSCFERKKNRFQPSPYLLEVAGSIVRLEADLPLPVATLAGSEEPPPLEVSFSNLALFQDCGYRYRLREVFGFASEIALELGYGRAVHHVLRQLAEVARERGAVPEPEEVDAIIESEFYLPFANAPAFARMRAAAARVVRTYSTEYAEDLQRVFATERPFELHVADGLVIGRADVILDKEGGEVGDLAIVDYKTTNDGTHDERYRMQLAVYAAAGRGEGLIVRAAYLHELRGGTRSDVDVSEETTATAIRSASEAISSIRRGEFRARPDSQKCKVCDLAQICSHRAGPA